MHLSWLSPCLLLGLMSTVPISPVMATEKPPAALAGYVDAVRRADEIPDPEARCAAYPDLPGNHWKPGSAAARCMRLRTPAPSLAEIDARLSQPDGAAQLERTFQSLLQAHYDDPRQREQIFIVMQQFDESPRAGDIAARWRKLAPKSAFALTADGAHHEHLGWQARGTAYARKTSQHQFDSMSKAFEKAVPSYLEALEINPKILPACHGLMAIGRQSSTELEHSATAICLKADPSSYFVVWEMITAAEPKWGGSADAMRRVVAYASAQADRNPMIGALLGEAAASDPALRARKFAETAERYAEIAKMAPSGEFHYNAGIGYRDREDWWPAFVYLSQALRFRPEEADWHAARGWLLYKLGEFEWAGRDMQTARRLDGSNGWYAYRMGQIEHRRTGRLAAARPFLLEAIRDERSRRVATRLYCGSFIPDSPAEGRKCVDGLLKDFPDDGEGWRLRAWLLSLDKDPAMKQALEKFVQYADPADEIHRQLRKELGVPFQNTPVQEVLPASPPQEAIPVDRETTYG